MGVETDVAALKANKAVTAREIASVNAENEELKKENAAIKAYLCSKVKKAPICK